jgi:NitT/TauT family transport system substrate-binding protein
MMKKYAVPRRAAAVAAVALLAACQGSGPAGGAVERTKISVGVIPIVDVAPVYLGIQRGFFARRGLDVTPHVAPSGSSIVSRVLERTTHFGFSNIVSMLKARQERMPVQVIAAGCSSTGDPAKDVHGVLVNRRSTIGRAKDLVGKKVAVNALDNVGDTTIKAAVEKDGGDPQSVIFVEMPFPEMWDQLATGKVDAILASEPFITQGVSRGGRILFDNLTETFPKLQISTYFTSQQLAADRPETVTAFVEAINESMTYASSHSQEVQAVLPTYMKITPEMAQDIILPAWPTELDVASATTVGQSAHKYGSLTQPPDVTGLFGKAGG